LSRRSRPRLAPPRGGYDLSYAPVAAGTMAVDFCLTLSSRRFGALPNRAATSTTVGQLRDASGRVLVASTPAEPAPTASTSAGQVLSRALIESPVEAGRIADGGSEE